ncbi:MAG: hypothetical protein ABIJ59_19535 [Pseudomonadota bacterium]
MFLENLLEYNLACIINLSVVDVGAFYGMLYGLNSIHALKLAPWNEIDRNRPPLKHRVCIIRGCIGKKPAILDSTGGGNKNRFKE